MKCSVPPASDGKLTLIYTTKNVIPFYTKFFAAIFIKLSKMDKSYHTKQCREKVANPLTTFADHKEEVVGLLYALGKNSLIEKQSSTQEHFFKASLSFRKDDR